MRTAALLFMACLAGIGLASDSVNVATSGQGRVERNSGSYPVSRVFLELHPDGRFKLFVNTEEAHTSLAGTYQEVQRRSYSVKVDSAFENSDSAGHGTIRLASGDRIESIDIKGLQGVNPGESRQTAFAVIFSGTGATDSLGGHAQAQPARQAPQRPSQRPRPHAGAFGPLTVPGRGTIAILKERSSIERVTYLLRPNGTFHITVEGDVSGAFDGTFKKDGSEYALKIRKLNAHPASGDGVLAMNAKAWPVKLSLDGRSMGGRYKASFATKVPKTKTNKFKK